MTTNNTIDIQLDPRELTGKKVGRLRRAGIVPVHLYGPGMEPRSLQCQASRLIKVLAAAGGATPVSITIQGESGTHLAFVREIQWDPRRDDVIHVDLLAANVRRPVSAQVPIILIGESPGARDVGGTVMQQLFTVDILALPLEMPSSIEIDLEGMTDPDSVIRVADLPLPATATVVGDPEDMVARIELPRAEEKVVVAEETEEEGAEADATEEAAEE
ncbi:MAG: 50S ribosomal protein L25 [Chloroflexi bacterium]|nr:50S ribosomal protein L25 [Chloroflexota bacterium]MDA1270840.1 50S ribosomal protein L25 [Chloroflexota bacterium]